MSRFEDAAEHARKVLPSAVADIIADVFLSAHESGHKPNPSTLMAMDEVMAMPVPEDFYVNADNGYKWLVHEEPCDEPVMEIDGGTVLADLIREAGEHRCGGSR